MALAGTLTAVGARVPAPVPCRHVTASEGAACAHGTDSVRTAYVTVWVPYGYRMGTVEISLL